MHFDEILYYGFIIHTIFILSIFDIYFKSPIIGGIRPTESLHDGLANRVVLISVDGLRLDSLFDKYPDTGQSVAPYSKYIIENKGTWGISESHLPTESRPGHVAMLAGFYEDPSAVTKGWKQNPVDFDSLFNTSKCVFAWGSPDIISMFSEGVIKDCLHVETYEDQSFSGTTTEYDNWVYDKVKEYLHFNSSKLFSKKSLFFLHLLGQDISGHTDKPHSSHYRHNLNNVDRIIQNIEVIFESHFKDKATTYIFTSDHGMTDWGSHGAGDPTETDTPFIAWGAGINLPQKPISIINTDWGLSQVQMNNINQADVTPLISILLGIPIPVNSIGQLPYSYLNTTQEIISRTLLTNALQMAEHFKTKMNSVKQQTFTFFYSEPKKINENIIKTKVRLIYSSINEGKYETAQSECKKLINLCLKGLDFYHNYYQRSLLFAISSSYILWTIILLLKISFNISFLNLKNIFTLQGFTFLTIIIIITLLIYLQNLPVLFNFYFNLPILFLWVLVNNKNKITESFKKFFSLKNIGIHFIFYFCSIELLVISFFKRWVLTLSMIFIILWLFYLTKGKSSPFILSFWLVSGVCVCSFPLLPVIGKKPKINQVLTSSILWIIFSFFTSLICFHKFKRNLCSNIVSVLVLVVTAWNIFSIYNYFTHYRELSTINQVLSLLLWFISTLNPFFTSKHLLTRLFIICLSLAVPFLLMTVNHEGFFLLSLVIHLFCWLYLEYTISKAFQFDKNIFDYSFETRYEVIETNTLKNFRISYFFLTYIFIGFFGIGNIASLNSFDPVWVRCFITTFSPFTMTGLILFKTIIPFLIITCILRGISVIVRIQIETIFVIVLMFCNLMGINFLFLVTNQGSWLDIGTSISHYVIQQTTVLFLVILYKVGNILTNFAVKIPNNMSVYFTKSVENVNTALPRYCQQVKSE